MPAWSRAGRLILRQGGAVGGCQGMSGTPGTPRAALPGHLQLSCAGHGAPRSASWAASPAVSTGRAVPGDKAASKPIPRARSCSGRGQQMHLSPVPKAEHSLGTSRREPWAWGAAGSGFGG